VRRQWLMKGLPGRPESTYVTSLLFCFQDVLKYMGKSRRFALCRARYFLGVVRVFIREQNGSATATLREIDLNLRLPNTDMLESMTAKQEAKSLLEKLPDNCSIEDIQYHLYVLEKVRSGLDDARQNSAISQEDAESRLSKWLSE